MAATALLNTSNAHGRYVGFFGDSRAFLSVTSSGQFYDALRNVGIVTWAQGLGGGRFTMPRSLNGGIAGNLLSDMLGRQAAYITTLTNANCKRVLVIGGTNDVTNLTTADQLGTMKKKMREIVRNFQQAGIAVEVISETPRGTGSSSYELATQVQRDALYQYHLWMENELSNMCVVHNVWDTWVNPASGLMYYPYPGFTEDGIHPSKIGAYWAGRIIGPGMGDRVHQLPDLAESNDLYNSSTFTGGSLITNPMLVGTAGTSQGGYTPVPGSVIATGWNTSVNQWSGNLKVYSYIEVDPVTGTSTQCFQITGTAGAQDEILQFNQTIPMTNVTEGKVVKNTAIIFTAGTGIANAAIRMLMTPSYTLKYDCENSNTNVLWPSDPITLFRETPLFTYAAAGGQTGLEFNFEMTLFRGTQVNAIFKIKKPSSFLVTY